MSDIETRIEGFLSQNYQVGSKEYWQARAEAAEAKLKASIEEDERMDCYQYGTKPTIDWKARAEAAEKRARDIWDWWYGEKRGHATPEEFAAFLEGPNGER